MSQIRLEHPSGASAIILLYGATIISWKSASRRDPEPQERLFLSSKAFVDGSKPVRGGIPVVFPCFGPPVHPDHKSLPQHGFARSELWAWDEQITSNDDGSVSVLLTLSPSPKIMAVYPNPYFRLEYAVTLAEFSISTEIRVRNTSPSAEYPPKSIEFQALLHNYLRAPAAQVLVSPLRDVRYYDKTESTEDGRTTFKVETRNSVDIHRFTDSVYENTSGHIEITWPGSGISLRKEGLKDLVIWNPQEEGKKIGDMEDRGWEKYICAEPGFVRGFCNVEPGHTWTGKQTLSVIHVERRLD